MTKRHTTPSQAITIRTYAQLRQFVEAFAAGHLNLLILLGDPGLAKSQTVRQVVGQRACWIEGNATAFGLYTTLWRHRDEPVIIDDLDSLYSDRAAIRLLKCLCQTDPVKQLAWYSAATGLERENIPRSFTTSSRTLIIANDWRTLNVNVAAVQDRGHVLSFEPTAEEVHGQTEAWFQDQDIFAWFGQHLHLIPRPSMRHYVRAAELKQAGLNWVRVLMSDTLPEKTLLVAELKADSRYQREEDRAQAFQDMGAGCRATYFNHARRLRRAGGSPAATEGDITRAA